MRKKQGSALIFVVTLCTLLLLVALAASIASVSSVGLTNDEKVKTKLEFACESGLKRAKAKIDESFNNNSLVSLTPNISFQGTDADDTKKTPAKKAYTDETYKSGDPGYYQFTFRSSEDNKTITVKYAITQDADWDTDINAVYDMKIEAIAYDEDNGFVGMSENVSAKRASLLMYLAFFKNNLEINPGSDFNLTGPIHTNGNLYLNSDDDSVLKIWTDAITAAGNIIRKRLDNNNATGNVMISSGSKSGTLVKMKIGDDSSNADWKNLAAKNWDGTVKDSSLGITEKLVPLVSPEALKDSGDYAKNAGLIIKTIGDKDYSDTRYEITLNGELLGSDFKNGCYGGALQEIDMLDPRENPDVLDARGKDNLSEEERKELLAKGVRVTIVDVDLLKKKSLYPDNGLIYMTRTDAKPDDGKGGKKVTGFELHNAGELPKATTFVSNLPTYIWGDLNKHTSGTDTWKPCGVIADSITLLSGNWSNCAATQYQGMQIAEDAEYNAAFIAGNVPTKGGNYSGGLENFLRLIQDWSGKKITIKGSFMQLFKSQYATSPWNMDAYKAATTRDWKYEDQFADLKNLPPKFKDMLPGFSVGQSYSGWKKISKSETKLDVD